MKKTVTLMVMLAALLTAAARPVDLTRARQLVEQHFFAPAVCISPAEWTELYVFVPSQGDGFAIISADDCTRPVLAYSDNASFSFEDMPAHVAAWLDGYRREVAELRKAGAVPGTLVQALWQQPKSGGLPAVAPMVTTRWNQSPWYNARCPYSASDSARAVTGCVATAMTQVMKYWNHPDRGHGQHGYDCEGFGWQQVTFDTLYDWDNMPDALGWGSSDAEVNAVAQLMYHAGVAVNMGYGVHSSGAYVTAYGTYNLPSSERALREYFRYSPMLHAVWKVNYSDYGWDSLMRHEIVHGRPILYSGHDNSGGHAFVLDGCDSMGMFHVNWGWGGAYDGYYTTDSLSPGAGGIGGNATYTFNLDNAALVGIMPSYGNDTAAVVNVVPIDSTMGTVVGNGTYVAYEDEVIIRAMANPGYRFDGWKSGNITNPIQFTLNGDYIDTALFLSVGRDTLGYSDEVYTTAWRDDYSTVTEWGIRIPAGLRNSLRSLSAVQLYVTAPGYYTLNIYYGDAIGTNTLVHTGQYDLVDSTRWSTISLAEPIPLLDDKPLWITFRFNSNTLFPAAASYYTGVSDGTWYKLPQGWVTFDDEEVFMTWMIRGVFSERPCHVAVENAGFCELDNLQGAGDYPLGETVTVSVSDPNFHHWEGIGSTENAITFVVTGDTTFYAYCEEVGIADVEDDAIDLPVRIYDIMGREVGTRRDDLLSLPQGVYLLRSPGRKAQKIVKLHP